jgi:cytochrome P450
MIVTFIYGIHHDPDAFEDPDVFRPERFLNEEGELIKNPRIMPFQAGTSFFYFPPTLPSSKEHM